MDNINSKFIKAVEFLEKINVIISRKELAEKLNYKPSTLTDIMKGRSAINSVALQNFCKMFNINLYWLFYGEGSMFSDLSEIDETPETPIKELNIEQRVEKLETLLNVR